MALMEVKLELGPGLGLLVRVLGLGGYELDYESSFLLLFYFCFVYLLFLLYFFLLKVTLEKSYLES